jgi:3-hydroxyanthranilate 3,4-dioxygenase
MILKIVEPNGTFTDVPIKEGDVFLLPGNIPHSPQRFENTLGIVLERRRPENSLDTLRWYCEKEDCKSVVYEESFYCVNLGTQLKPVIDAYFANDEKRTCGKCGHVNPKK